MEFSALFLGVVTVMTMAWWGSRKLVMALFAVALAASVVTFIHHATDVLNLSF